MSRSRFADARGVFPSEARSEEVWLVPLQEGIARRAVGRSELIATAGESSAPLSEVRKSTTPAAEEQRVTVIIDDVASGCRRSSVQGYARVRSD